MPDDFSKDPDYAIRWPRPFLEAELGRLIDIGVQSGTTRHWEQMVDTLLRQAFDSNVPRTEFHLSRSQWPNDEEEPF